MVVDSLFYSELCPAEQWFKHIAQGLNLIAPPLEPEQIKIALKTHLPARFERVLPRLEDPEDTQQWLNLILKSLFVIRLWRSTDEPVLIALAVSGSLKLAKQQLDIIKSPEFSAARQELGIAKHWFLVVPGYPAIAPSRDELLDMLYAQLEVESECALVQ